MIWHSSTISDIEQKMNTDAEKGLTSQTVEQKLAKYGQNLVEDKKKRGVFKRFLDQLKDTMVIILMIAAAISMIITLIDGVKSWTDWMEPLIIIAIVVCNAVLGVIQESRAENALEALKKLETPSANVIRDGKHQVIDARMLVPGDVITFEAGDYIPADARLVEAYSLRCDESMLTGESLPAEKEAGVICDDIAPIGDRQNMVFSGCSVSYGRGKAIVVETGSYTEMGKIAVMLKENKAAVTPLQMKLAQLGKILGIIALVVCAIIFVVGKFMGLGWMEMFMTAVSLAVAAIPEGLPAIVTIVLAMGVQRMVKQNAIIRRLPAVETLGSASVICSDKTGTLTQNRMTVVKAYANKAMYTFGEDAATDDLLVLMRLLALCCDAKAEEKNGEWLYIGDPTETAIVKAAVQSLGTDQNTLNLAYPRMCELPFDSERKLMSVVCVIDGKPFSIVKGGIDIIIERCKNIDLESVKKANESMANDALRVLGIAIKPLGEVPSNPTNEQLEYGLTFMGLVGLIDPLREEAKTAVAECRTAGIRTIMITGDHITTARAIAKQLGIMNNAGDIAITGAQLDEMDDDELAEKLEHICVYARVSPENKIRIVKAWQEKGETVAMTGDGVNDAPALQAADIGCAMGITGTDVAKSAAAMTLTDDNFATIVTAVKQGRGIFDNIRKAVHFLLSCNLGEILAVFLGLLIFEKAPLTPILLLWLNLVTDSLPALALGVEPTEKDIMKHKPRAKNEGIFSRSMGIDSIWQGIMFGALTLIAYAIGIEHGADYARTMAFAVLSISQLVHSMNCRSEHSLFYAGWFRNPKIWGAFFASLSLVAAVMFIPILREAFGLAQLGSRYLLEIGLLSIVPFVACEIVKGIRALLRNVFHIEFERKPKAKKRAVGTKRPVNADTAVNGRAAEKSINADNTAVTDNETENEQPRVEEPTDTAEETAENDTAETEDTSASEPEEENGSADSEPTDTAEETSEDDIAETEDTSASEPEEPEEEPYTIYDNSEQIAKANEEINALAEEELKSAEQQLEAQILNFIADEAETETDIKNESAMHDNDDDIGLKFVSMDSDKDE